MHDNDIIQKFDLASLVECMEQCGLPSSPSKHKSGSEVAQRSFTSNGRRLTYCVTIDGDTLKCVGEIDVSPKSTDFIVHWNNISPISPLIGLKAGCILKFDTNIRRSMTFASFYAVISKFEQAMARLDIEIRK